MHVAVLDLGTNTFNLIIARTNTSDFTIVYSHKIPVKLGEKSNNQNEIHAEAYRRGIEAVLEHHRAIKEYHADKIYAFGTAAIRTSVNGKNFTEEIYSKTRITIDIIEGDKEAELIYLGVKQTISLAGKYLILDIGGGSNEFIIADNERIYWKKSFKLGIALLLEMFSPSDPLSENDIHSIISYFEDHLQPLVRKVNEHQVKTLIGASGSFETFVAMIEARKNFISEVSMEAKSTPIKRNDFDMLYNKLIKSSHEERLRMEGLEPMRAEMIVLAAVFVKFILKKLNIKHLYQSNFALKEGVLYQLLNK
jgi:exopolyphosphatase / guanosine-5'-triphosphate,3'-diphosphate pyrophosphatase